MFAFDRVLGKHFCSRFTVHRTDCCSSLTVFNNIQYRTDNILLVSTGLLDDFLIIINIDSKLSGYPASRAKEATTKPGCSFFRQIHICARSALVCPSFSLSVLFFICTTNVFRPSCPAREKAHSNYISFRPLKHLNSDP